MPSKHILIKIEHLTEISRDRWHGTRQCLLVHWTHPQRVVGSDGSKHQGVVHEAAQEVDCLHERMTRRWGLYEGCIIWRAQPHQHMLMLRGRQALQSTRQD